jgi:hypothetical protein
MVMLFEGKRVLVSGMEDIDKMLSIDPPRPRPARAPSRSMRKPLIFSLKEWASSQVSAYRVGLVMGYIAMMYYGTSAFIAGVPVFIFTAPQWWTPVWSLTVIAGGLVAGIGAIRAGAEPVTREVKIYNRIELVGSIMLFITLGSYAVLLLIIGYGYGDAGRASVGAGFVALGIHPAVRMLWLIFRPRFLAMRPKHQDTIALIPQGHALFAVDESGAPVRVVAVAKKPETK